MDETKNEEQTACRSLMGYDTRILGDHELYWLEDPDGNSLFSDLVRKTCQTVTPCSSMLILS